MIKILQKITSLSFIFFIVAIFTACSHMTGSLIVLPDKTALQKVLNIPPISVKVADPYMSTTETLQEVKYVGYPVEKVLDAFFSTKWRDDDNQTIAFIGSESLPTVVPVKRFKEHKAYLVFDREEAYHFTNDYKIMQNENTTKMGPYFLVWDSISAPEKIETFLPDWSFQISEIALSSNAERALLPKDMAATHAQAAQLTKQYCLGCHQVNDIGSKNSVISPMNLAKRIKTMNESTYYNWVFNPKRMMPSTIKEPILQDLPENERIEIAAQIYHYLKELPISRSHEIDFDSHHFFRSFIQLDKNTQAVILLIQGITIWGIALFFMKFMRRFPDIKDWAPHPPTSVAVSGIFALFLAFHGAGIWQQKVTAERAFNGVAASVKKFSEFINPSHIDSAEMRTHFRQYLLTIVHEEWYRNKNKKASEQASELLSDMYKITVDLGKKGELSATNQSYMFKLLDDLGAARSARLWIGTHHIDSNAWTVVLWLGFIAHLGLAAVHFDKPRAGRIILSLFAFATTSSYWLLVIANNPYSDETVLNPEILLRIVF